MGVIFKWEIFFEVILGINIRYILNIYIDTTAILKIYLYHYTWSKLLETKLSVHSIDTQYTVPHIHIVRHKIKH
jgi:hypothetical protein